MSTPKNQNLAARQLLTVILADPGATHFKVLPDPILYPDYYAFISRPIALADINTSINSGPYSLPDMTRDLRRMFANAKKYNKPEAQVYQDALALEVRIYLYYIYVYLSMYVLLIVLLFIHS